MSVDQRRVARCGPFDVPSSALATCSIQGDGHQLGTLRLYPLPQFPPHGQVVGACSVGRPGEQNDFLSNQAAEVELFAFVCRKGENGRLRRVECAHTNCVGADCPDTGLVDEGKSQPLGQLSNVDIVPVEIRERDADVSFASSLGLQRPPGPVLEFAFGQDRGGCDHASECRSCLPPAWAPSIRRRPPIRVTVGSESECVSMPTRLRLSRPIVISSLTVRWDAPLIDRDLPPTPEALIRRVVDGDQVAFSALYDLLSPVVYGLAVRVCRSRHLAEEVTQEVFVQVWDQADRFDRSKGSARSWVATIAHRRAVDAVRKTQAAIDRDAALPPDPPSRDLAEDVIDLDETERVRTALDRLTDLQREVIELAYFGGRTYREVAELLGAPLGTVKTRMRDGLARIRSELEWQDG